MTELTVEKGDDGRPRSQGQSAGGKVTTTAAAATARALADAGIERVFGLPGGEVLVLMDELRRVGIDFGVYGVPETFIIDRDGVIVEKIIGPITPLILREKLLPLVAELRR